MNEMNDESAEIAQYISNLEIKSEDVGMECDHPDHRDNNRIREGNSIYCIITEDEQGWRTEYVSCIRCDVKPLTSKLDKFAVVEANIQYDTENELIEFEEPQVWEMTRAR